MKNPYQTIYDSELVPNVYVSIRKYPKRYYIAYEDYRLDLSSGADVEDCYDAPTYIFKRVPHEQFSLPAVLQELKTHLNH